MNKNTVVLCEKLYKTYQDGDKKVEILKGLNLALDAGTTLAIVGSSGSGKSTLLHMLGTLDKPDSGLIEIKGCDTTQ